MKKFLVFLCAISLILGIAGASGAYMILSASDPALTGASVIDFESETKGQYTSLTTAEVTFITDPSFLTIDDSYSGSYNTTGQYLDNWPGSPFGFGSITFSFSTTTSAFGFNWGASDDDWVLEAYDAGDGLIESYTLPQVGDSNAGEFYGIAAENIAYATLTETTFTYGLDYIFMDNFTYAAGAEPVPEPSTMLLIGSGLIGLAGFRKKFKNS